jgi:gamma-glutamyl phosphate reductase
MPQQTTIRRRPARSSYAPDRFVAWRRVGASLVGLALASNPNLAEAIAGWCTALGRAICLRSGWQAKRALRQLVRLADYRRRSVTPASARPTALLSAEVLP